MVAQLLAELDGLEALRYGAVDRLPQWMVMGAHPVLSLNSRLKVQQGRLFQNGTRRLEAKHTPGRRRAVAGPRRRPSGAAAQLGLRRMTRHNRLQTRGLPRRLA